MIPTAARQAVYDLANKRQQTRVAVVVSPVFWEGTISDEFDQGVLDDTKWLHSEPKPEVTGTVLNIKSYGAAPFEWVVSRPLWIPAQDLSLPFEISLDVTFPQTDPGYTQAIILGCLDGGRGRNADPMRIYQMGHNKTVSGLSAGDILVELGPQQGTLGYSFANDQAQHTYTYIWDPRTTVEEPEETGDTRAEVLVDATSRLEQTDPNVNDQEVPFSNTARPFYLQIGVVAEFDQTSHDNAPGTPAAPVNVISVDSVQTIQHDTQGYETRVWPGWTAPGGSGLNEAAEGERFEMGGETWAKMPGVVDWSIEKGRERTADSFTCRVSGIDPDDPTAPNRFIADRLVGRPLVIDTAITDGSEPVSNIADPTWGEIVDPSPVGVSVPSVIGRQLCISRDRQWVCMVTDGPASPAVERVQIYPWNEVTKEWGTEVPQDYPDPPHSGAGGARDADFHPSGTWLAVGSIGGSAAAGHIRIYSFDPATGEIGQLADKFFDGTNETHQIQFSPDGAYLARACRNVLEVYTFDELTGQIAEVASTNFGGMTEDPWGMDWHPSGDFIACATLTSGPVALRFDRKTNSLGPELRPSSGPTGAGVDSTVAWTPSGNALLYVGTAAAQGYDVWSFTEAGGGAFLNKWSRPAADAGIDYLVCPSPWEKFFVTYDNADDVFAIHILDHASETVLSDPALSVSVTDVASNGNFLSATESCVFYRRSTDPPGADAICINNPPSEDEWIRQIAGIIERAEWMVTDDGHPQLVLRGKDRPAKVLDTELRRTYINQTGTFPAVNVGFSIDDILADLFDVASAIYEGDRLRDVVAEIQYNTGMQPQSLGASGSRLAEVYTQITDELAMSYWKRYRTFGDARWGKVFTHRWFGGLGAASGQTYGPSIPWHHLPTDDGYWQSGGGTTFSNTGTFLRLGDSGAATLHHIFIKFPFIQLPPGCTVTRAQLALFSQGAGASATFNTTIYANRANDGFVPLNQAEADAMALTTGTAWAGTATWADNVWVKPPDIAAEIQEIVDLPGYQDGAGITIIIRTNSASATFDFDSEESTQAMEARLLLEFSDGSQYTFRGEASTLGANNISRAALIETDGPGMVAVHADNMFQSESIFTGGIPGPADFPGTPYPPRAPELHMSIAESGTISGLTEGETRDRRGNPRRGGPGILKFQRESAWRRTISLELFGHDWLEPDDEFGLDDPRDTGVDTTETFVVDALQLRFQNDSLTTLVRASTSDWLRAVRRGI